MATMEPVLYAMVTLTETQVTQRAPPEDPYRFPTWIPSPTTLPSEELPVVHLRSLALVKHNCYAQILKCLSLISAQSTQFRGVSCATWLQGTAVSFSIYHKLL